jgi:hypothetical protein
MKRSTQAVLSFGIGYLIFRTGVAIYRHPVGSAVVLTILLIWYAVDGASALEVVHAARSLIALYTLIFIIGLACAGRGFRAFMWFVVWLTAISVFQAWIDSVQQNYDWWMNHSRWWPSPLALCTALLLFALRIIQDTYFPFKWENERKRRVVTTAAGD